MEQQTGHRPKAGYSLALFGELFCMWAEWQRGIPPGEEWQGRGAQSPWVLRAFDALDRAKARAEKDMSTAPKLGNLAKK